MINVTPAGDPKTIAVIGEAQGYNGLSVRFDRTFDHAIEKQVPSLNTVWKPTPEELEILNNGGVITIELLARQHPPILVGVFRHE